MTEQLDYEQLLTLWNITGKPTDVESLVPIFGGGTPQAEKRFLSKSKVGFVEGLLRGDQSALPDRTYTNLARARRVGVRRLLAQNSNTSSEAFAQLASDEEQIVREEARKNLEARS